jgi:hypothetical protein
VQTGKEINKDFSIEDIKNTKLLSLENTLRNRDLSDTPTDKQKDKQCISFDI